MVEPLGTVTTVKRDAEIRGGGAEIRGEIRDLV
jgi:hypothetical protein